MMFKWNTQKNLLAVLIASLLAPSIHAKDIDDRLVRADHFESVVKPLNAHKITGKSKSNNLMTFSSPVKNIYVPPGFDLPKPSSVNDDRTLIFSPDKNMGDIPLTINLVSGENLSFVLSFSDDVAPFFFEQAKSSDVPKSKKPASKRTSEKYIANAFVDAFEGRIPAGFVVDNNLEHFEVDVTTKDGKDIRLAMHNNTAYKSDSHRIKKWTVSAETLVPVTNEDFFEERDIAIFIDKDYVSPEAPLTLIKLEAINDQR